MRKLLPVLLIALSGCASLGPLADSFDAFAGGMRSHRDIQRPDPIAVSHIKPF